MLEEQDNLMQNFELWLERKINNTIESYLENNPVTGDIDDDRIKDIAREEAQDIVENATFSINGNIDIDVSI